MTPALRVTAPTRQVTAPACHLTAPTRRVTAPARRVTAPARRVTAPARQVTAPAHHLTEPTRRVTAPTPAPDNESIYMYRLYLIMSSLFLTKGHRSVIRSCIKVLNLRILLKHRAGNFSRHKHIKTRKNVS